MTMDYRNPYSIYPEYYCPPYQGAGYQYPQQQQHYHPQQQQQQQHHYLDQSAVSGQQKNYNSSAAAPPPHPQQQYLPPQHQQRPPHYHPAFHQHNQQQQQHSHYASPYLPNFLVSSGTGLTPSLTPTTIATIEQSFLELQSAQQNRVYESVAQSGFVPPVIDAGHSTEVSQDSQEYSSEYSDAEWEPAVKRGRMSQVMKDINNVDLIVTANGTTNAAPQRKYTRRNKDEKLPPEEEEKRRVRRERNKLAAAKCRQRRVDHTNILVAETEKLEAEQSQLESEIQNLQYVKDQLEFVLQAHQPLCKVEKSNSHSDKLKTDIVFNRIKPDTVFSSLKSEKDQIEFFLQCRSPADKVKHEPGSCAAGCDSCSSHDTSSLVPENLSLSTSASLPSNKAASSSVSATLNSSSIMETSAFNSRPTSLPLVKRERSSMLSSATGITIDTPSSGVSITPSSLFYPGLDSMVDGSTGLTPLTGMSCSSQVQQNTSEGRSESESNLISL